MVDEAAALPVAVVPAKQSAKGGATTLHCCFPAPGDATRLLDMSKEMRREMQADLAANIITRDCFPLCVRIVRPYGTYSCFFFLI
jgi:hypothetical protein